MEPHKDVISVHYYVYILGSNIMGRYDERKNQDDRMDEGRNTACSASDGVIKSWMLCYANKQIVPNMRA